ncbi:hypothetical protein DFH09DRAFT_1076028 [Mycena vulgaris]|nr:hypothetical protein DFH09DRAFT_1076028 [Mycena vulgaris]
MGRWVDEKKDEEKETLELLLPLVLYEYRVTLPFPWLLVLSTELHEESLCDGEWCIPARGADARAAARPCATRTSGSASVDWDSNGDAEEDGGGAEKDKGGGGVARLGRSQIGSKPPRYERRGGRRSGYCRGYSVTDGRGVEEA